jgi:hypothetical protein
MSLGNRIGSTGLQKGQADSEYLNESANLSDLDNVATARTNLDVYSQGESDNRFVNEAGDTMTGNLDMDNNKIQNVANSTTGQDAVNLQSSLATSMAINFLGT